MESENSNYLERINLYGYPLALSKTQFIKFEIRVDSDTKAKKKLITADTCEQTIASHAGITHTCRETGAAFQINQMPSILLD